jgi:hypothetical protein
LGLPKINVISTIDINLLHELFPSELMDYFSIWGFQTLCSMQTKTEYWLIDFLEKNELPPGYSFTEYETKDFMESNLIQDFPLRGKAVFLRIKLSDFLKDAGGYQDRYHEQHSQLLWG